MVQGEQLELYEEFHKRFYIEEGRLFYRDSVKGNHRAVTGTEVGYDRGDGYKSVVVNYKAYLVHRVMFLMYNKYLPDLVDHVDRDTANNLKENLREANKSINSWNTGKQVNNKSGYRGVSWSKVAGKWHSYINHKGKRIHIGFFDCVVEASEAYWKKREQILGKDNYLRG